MAGGASTVCRGIGAGVKIGNTRGLRASTDDERSKTDAMTFGFGVKERLSSLTRAQDLLAIIAAELTLLLRAVEQECL